MDQMPNIRRSRWSDFAAGLVLAAIALGTTALVAPHAFAQAGAKDGAATVKAAAGDAIEQVDGRWEGGLKVLIVIALFVVPIIVGSWLAKQLKMPEHGWKFAVAIGTIAAAAIVVATGEIRLGPDLSGGITTRLRAMTTMPSRTKQPKMTAKTTPKSRRRKMGARTRRPPRAHAPMAALRATT
jgi:hypothetical protein